MCRRILTYDFLFQNSEDNNALINVIGRNKQFIKSGEVDRNKSLDKLYLPPQL